VQWQSPLQLFLLFLDVLLQQPHLVAFFSFFFLQQLWVSELPAFAFVPQQARESSGIAIKNNAKRKNNMCFGSFNDAL
jgi:hypothetical protein